MVFVQRLAAALGPLVVAASLGGCSSSYSLNERPEREGDDAGECSDAADNDSDGAFDCDDPDCTGAPECDATGCADVDGDGVCDGVDACPGSDDGLDLDADGVADGCDPCPADANDDSDGDGVCDGVDACPGSDDAIDLDGDGLPDGCDPVVGGRALRFDGLDDYLEAPFDPSLNTQPTGLTVEVWVYFDQIATDCMTMLWRGTSQQIAQEYRLEKSWSPPDQLLWTGWQSWVTVGPAVLTGGTWLHVAGTWDPATGLSKVWVDGVERGSLVAVGLPTLWPEPLRMGADWNLGCPLDGVLEEVRISSVARYTSPFVPARRFAPDGDTMALWHFDEGSGATAFDSSGNGNHAVINGAAWTTEQPP